MAQLNSHNKEKISKATKTKKNGNGKDLGINLLEFGTKEQAARTTKAVSSHVLGALFGGIIVVALAYGALFFYGYQVENQLADLRKEQREVEADISSLEAAGTKLVAFQNELSNISGLLSDQTYWSNFFASLEQHTINDVVFVNVVASPNGSINMAGIAEDYTALARQLKVFQEATDLIQDVSITSGNAVLSPEGGVVGVNFDVSLTLKKEELTRKE